MERKRRLSTSSGARLVAQLAAAAAVVVFAGNLAMECGPFPDNDIEARDGTAVLFGDLGLREMHAFEFTTTVEAVEVRQRRDGSLLARILCDPSTDCMAFAAVGCSGPGSYVHYLYGIEDCPKRCIAWHSADSSWGAMPDAGSDDSLSIGDVDAGCELHPQAEDHCLWFGEFYAVANRTNGERERIDYAVTWNPGCSSVPTRTVRISIPRLILGLASGDPRPSATGS